ncbi:fumarate hydratase [Thermanaerosceptrum fracticalcis]|uniref:Fumarate hydratase n=1 Tax=Thermanaerosceptrum fracticalcis TaxID=1712410 RepID=A0A7G6E6C8_THEFR|nr:fumarate hydratase [Thermanaerosceptrum fracticalcis]QNB47632.1 fumarate hydratase [Thermanaerosceptrum fracticalcis]
MRIIKYDDVVETVAKLCKEANYYLGNDVLEVLQSALEKEESEAGKEVLNQLLDNARLGLNNDVPVCQDTGTAVVFLEYGQDVSIDKGSINDAINEGVRKGYIEGYLRKSVVDDPLIKRINTKDNTPAVIHTTVVPGDKLKITVAPKGGGAENCSAIKMMTPSDGYNGVKKFVIDTVLKAGPNPCPPIVVGVGIGGNFEKAAFLAKKALIRPLNQNHPDPQFAALEKELLEEINELGIGPQGFGGRITALKVNVETFPCHIASMPVAVNINCHSTRHKSAVL